MDVTKYIIDFQGPSIKMHKKYCNNENEFFFLPHVGTLFSLPQFCF